MTTTTTTEAALPAVDVKAYVTSMTHHWSTALQNIPSQALQAVWSQMARTFNRQIINHGTSEGNRWKVLQPATGTGKTQGLAVYASMLPREGHPGVLIVVRLIVQADSLRSTINELAGEEVATAFHSSDRRAVAALDTWPVLIITHAAYENAVDDLNGNWGRYHTFAGAGGQRKLTVIDEALDIIQEARVDLDDVRWLRGCIPLAIERRFPQEVTTIDAVVNTLRLISEQAEEGGTVERSSPRAAVVQRERRIDIGGLPANCDMTELRRAIASVKLDVRHLRRRNAEVQAALQRRAEETLKAVSAVLSSWAWYARKLSDHTLNSARLIIPDGITGAVILDATASANLLYQLFDGWVDIVPVPSRARRYDNVTLHVSTGHAVGKLAMEANAHEETVRLVNSLKTVLPDAASRKVFVCCHKNVEPHLMNLDTSMFGAFDAAHWGAIDGRNDWSDYDTAVIFGLPYRDKTWSANAFMAAQGAQDDAWLNGDNGRPFKGHVDIRHSLEVGQLVVNIVQAINRVRCRRTADGEGGCLPTDILILLPRGKAGEEVLSGVVAEMDDIVVKRWSYSSAEQKVRKSNHTEALVRWASALPSGSRVAATEVKRELGISPSRWKSLAEQMKDAATTLYQRLGEAGVSYRVNGRGRAMVALLERL